jgi:predicted RNA-binding protein with TRAM domain
MPRDNEDKYGKVHRDDENYDIGDPSPGTGGDSKGTGESGRSVSSDRTREHTNVESMDSFFDDEKTKKTSSNSSSNKYNQKFSEGERVEVEILRISNSDNPIAEKDGTHIHVEGGKEGETAEVEIQEIKSGYVEAKKIATE